MCCAGQDQVPGIAILAAEAPAARKDRHVGRRPMAVARQLRTDETLKQDTVFEGPS